MLRRINVTLAMLLAAVLAGSLYQFWDLHGHYAEGRRSLARVRGHVARV